MYMYIHRKIKDNKIDILLKNLYQLQIVRIYLFVNKI